jgi:hypothetical protein
MGFIASAIPAIASGIGGLVGKLAGNKTVQNTALGVGGAALGALGSSGKQGSNTTSSTIAQTEDPAFAQYRQALMPLLTSELSQAQQPVFGDAQKTSFMTNLNNLAQSSMNALRSNMARFGGLSSGRYGAGLTNIQLGKLGQSANFFSQLPFMEAQARAERVQPLLNTALSWVGRPPTSTTTTGDTSAYGPSFGSQFATDLGALGGLAFTDWWKKRNAGTTTPSGVGAGGPAGSWLGD